MVSMMKTNQLVHPWLEFEMKMRIQFGPLPYDDPNIQLVKLVQTDSVADYEVQFQHLTKKIPVLPESFLKGCYIGGLSTEVRPQCFDK